MRMLLGMLVLPAFLAAQNSVVVSPFGARNDALPDSPYLLGLSLTSYSGPIGLRIGGAAGRFEQSSAPGEAQTLPFGAWVGDADLLIAPGATAASTLGAILPAGFIGVGIHGVRRFDGIMEQAPLMSYGAMLTTPVGSTLRIETDARYRRPFAAEADLPEGFSRNWEFRVGLGLRFGGARAGRAPAERVVARRVPNVVLSAARAPVTARRVLSTADRHVGSPYKYGGSSPVTGFDCSGFVQYVFRKHGIELPRTSRQMNGAGERIDATVASLRTGDLMMFAQSGTRIDHVAIYAGNGRIIHSSASGGGVRYDDLSKPRGRWFAEHWVAARRVIGSGSATDFVKILDDALRLVEQLDPPDRAPAP